MDFNKASLLIILFFMLSFPAKPAEVSIQVAKKVAENFYCEKSQHSPDQIIRGDIHTLFYEDYNRRLGF